ncbi:MAG: DUF2892 domain-containing protein [Gammaproteobacteria bacterium]|nr:DUF2892 domain-containing protein [Gammaproteobacteria bacterium]MCF6229839.1 DUF2892 domain-containing protein [Gammaproteobacteria bacterium]
MITHITRTMAGTFILLSLLLGVESSPVFQHQNWLWLTLFVGINLFQSGLTHWCLMDKILAKMGFSK